jgi:hypothetical protein
MKKFLLGTAALLATLGTAQAQPLNEPTQDESTNSVTLLSMLENQVNTELLIQPADSVDNIQTAAHGSHSSHSSHASHASHSSHSSHASAIIPIY